MNKLYSNLDENNPSHKLIIDINKKNEEKYGPYHDECGLFQSFCRCHVEDKKIERSKFNKACLDIANTLISLKYDNGDASDIGNEIGIIIGKYISEDQSGWEKSGFISGINHGISLTDGTHG